jgi:ankyrin repeat protein
LTVFEFYNNGEERMSDLLDAIEHFDDNKVRQLLKEGATVNIHGYGGVTPLHLAVEIEMEKAIYRYDTTGDITPPDGKFVNLLMDYGADIETKDDNGGTPLDWAKKRNHLAAIEAMLHKNAA